MTDFFYRTEDFKAEEVANYFVETKQDRQIVDALKARNPVILVGSRGVGKSFLLRVAEQEQTNDFDKNKVLPVYATFTKSSLVHTSVPLQFTHWMLSKLCERLIRTLTIRGLLSTIPSSISILAGGHLPTTPTEKSQIEKIADAFEDSWKDPGTNVDMVGLPTIEAFKDAIEDVCKELQLERISFYLDEAAHIFLPEQQRQFFTLYRDLRSPYITCNATVYPGMTFFGETFERAHDATILNLDRDILSSDYVSNMRDIVEKQADSTITKNISTRGDNFAVLAYAASGNPRILLKTISRASSIASREVNDTIREYYRTDIWSEHSALVEKYTGHSSLIDWGRRFIEEVVLPELRNKNEQYLKEDKNSTCFFWIHKNAPATVIEAIRLLAYTGIVTEHSKGIKGTRGEVGTRYAVSLGALFALEPTPTKTAFNIAKKITPKRMSEYGANHAEYNNMDMVAPFVAPDSMSVLKKQLERPIDVLDLSRWQKDKLFSRNINTIGDLLGATEEQLQELPYIGGVRSRKIRNTALTAVFEYLSG